MASTSPTKTSNWLPREAVIDRREQPLIKKARSNEQFFSYLETSGAALCEKAATLLTSVGEA
jgi:hypothetical protein